MRFITFNAIRADVPFKLVIPVHDIVMAFSQVNGNINYVIVKGGRYKDFGAIHELDKEMVIRIELTDSKGIDELSKIKK